MIAYHVLRDGVSYRELGADYFDHLNAQRLTRYHTQRLAALGYDHPREIGGLRRPPLHFTLDLRRICQLPVHLEAGGTAHSWASWSTP